MINSYHFKKSLITKGIQRLGFVLLLLSTTVSYGQKISLPGSANPPKTKAAPKPYKNPAPVVSSQPAAKVATTEVRIVSNVSAKLIFRIYVNGRNITNEIIVNKEDLGSYKMATLAIGDASLEIQLNGQKSYSFPDFFAVTNDLANIEVIQQGGQFYMNRKTRTQLKEEAQLKVEMRFAELVSELESSIKGLYLNTFASNSFNQSIRNLLTEGFIDKRIYDLGISFSGKITELNQSYEKVKTQTLKAEFYKFQNNFVIISAARTDLNAAKSQWEAFYKGWTQKFTNTTFLENFSTYLKMVQNDLNNLPSNQANFNAKVADVLANWEKIKAEEERVALVKKEALERERQRQRELEQERLRQIELEEERKLAAYLKWNRRSGIFGGISWPLGIEFGVLAPDRMGNMWGLRYSNTTSNEAPLPWISLEKSRTKYEVHNCMTFPVAEVFQLGITVSMALETYTDNLYYGGTLQNEKKGNDMDVGLGVRGMYVEERFMAGLEYIYGFNDGIAGGLFLVVGYKLGNL
jgi:hypothetical protein